MSSSRALILIGPGQHFGLELAQRFAREGFAVGIITQSAATAALFNDIALHHRLVDVGDAVALADAIRGLSATIGVPNCIIYNARSPGSGDALSLTPAQFDTAMQVNVTGALVAAQTAASLMHGIDKATVIFTGGGYKDRPHPQKCTLSVGKAALHALAECLEAPLRDRGIAIKTVVIDGMVRRDDETAISAAAVADIFWNTYNGLSGLTQRIAGN